MQTVKCTNCQSLNISEAKFCSQCGAKLEKTEPAQINVKVTEATCPVCDRDDQTAKLSAIVASQTSTSSSSGYSHYTHTSHSAYSSSTTALGQLLSPPKKPTQFSLVDDIMTLIGKSVSLIGILLSGLIGLIMLSADGGPWCICPTVIFTLSVWGILHKKEPSQQELDRQNEETAQWEEAIRRWYESYYCSRCHVVFFSDDTTQHYVDASVFRDQLLYSDL